MNDSMMQEILKRLDVLAEKLGAGGAYTWEALMRQAFWIQGVWTLVLAIALSLTTYALVKLAFWFCRPDPDAEKKQHSFGRPIYAIEDEVGRGIGVSLSIIGTIITGISAVVNLWNAVAHLANPQYYALMDLAKMLTGK